MRKSFEKILKCDDCNCLTEMNFDEHIGVFNKITKKYDIVVRKIT